MAESHFLALLSRMKYIERWALMRSSRAENLSEHSLEVALIAHMLCVIGNVRFGRSLNAERAALVALYHDASEIITGDMPTPVKYHDGEIREAYRAVEKSAEERLVATLPDDLRPVYEGVFWTGEDAGKDELYLRRLVKAADKISALIKCVDEARSGNAEFESAEKTCRAAVDKMAAELPEVADFVAEFLPSYGATLDELL
ncbi:MAG TPA: 5'-deoxynucleotidase [Candidatus Olsenella pullicola]|nr:5'-deoxynucleotidase [Candidatus Olsenella pullicola]